MADGRWRVRAPVVTGTACAVALLLAGHRLVPDAGPRPGSLLEAFLPWIGLAVPVLAVVALVRRSRFAAVSVLLPAAVWAGVFGPRLPGGDRRAGDLTVVQHNVAEENTDPAGTAAALVASGADLVAVEELVEPAAARYGRILGAAYPYRARSGTVGLWSRYPLADVRPLDLRPAGVPATWQRGVRATARTPRGDLAVYVAHLPSVRITATGGFATARRDSSAAKLGALLAAEPERRVLLLGDLNGGRDDRGLAPVFSRLTTGRQGVGLSWPAALPLARIDQVLGRAVTPVAGWTLPRTGSDHLPVAARVRL